MANLYDTASRGYLVGCVILYKSSIIYCINMHNITPTHKTMVRLAWLMASLALVLYPFSHFPAILFQASPFQLLGILIGLIGVGAGFHWMVRHTTRLSKMSLLNQPVFWAVILLCWTTLSFVWGQHTLHQIYTIGLLWLGFFFALGLLVCFKVGRLQPKQIARILLVVGVILSLFCVYQFIGDSLGFSRSYTQICVSCTQQDVGFSRVSGFSLEPEFLSVILLLPLMITAHTLFTRHSSFKPFLVWLSAMLLLLPYFLGASRSGLLALVVCLGGFLLTGIILKKYRFCLDLVGAVFASFILTLVLVAWSGGVHGGQGARYSIERYVSHVSAGYIKIGGEEARVKRVEQTLKQKQAQTTEEGQPFSYVKDTLQYGQSGSVIYSTQSRLETYKLAVKIWLASPKNFLIGVGWGGFGAAAQKYNSAFTPINIVNNQPLQFAVELGAVGLSLALLVVVSLVRFILRSKNKSLKLSILLLLAGYSMQLLFFSGLHLLQFWLTFALIFYILDLKTNLLTKDTRFL